MINSTNRSSNSYFSGVDPIAIILYVIIVLIGCVCITSASFDETSLDYFNFSHFYIKQIMWACIAFIAAIFVLLMDVHIFHKYAYPLYAAGVFVLLLTLLFGREVNGAKSWFELGAFRIQPVEMAKITTAIAMARVMSEYNFSIDKIYGLSRVAAVIAIPLAVIILQNDTGSGIVFCSFIFVLYREGLNSWLCVPIILVTALFILSFLLTPLVLLILSIIASIICDAAMNRLNRGHIIYLAIVILITVVANIYSWWSQNSNITTYNALLIASFATTPLIIIHALRNSLKSRIIVTGLFLFSNVFIKLCDYIFNNILREHQQNRIMSFLGIVNDPLGIDYNVNQSKIAIGSGRLWGKGFLDGTQIKYGFVPERHTDFIFCDLAEEWGFIGVTVLLGAFLILILRLIKMGERQNEAFGRVYCYCVASILLFHIFVNIGMTIGIMPVMGIPLPFVSYGGSSLVAFTIMLFIAFRLDSSIQK